MKLIDKSYSIFNRVYRKVVFGFLRKYPFIFYLKKIVLIKKTILSFSSFFATEEKIYLYSYLKDKNLHRNKFSKALYFSLFLKQDLLKNFSKKARELEYQIEHLQIVNKSLFNNFSFFNDLSFLQKRLTLFTFIFSILEIRKFLFSIELRIIDSLMSHRGFFANYKDIEILRLRSDDNFYAGKKQFKTMTSKNLRGLNKKLPYWRLTTTFFIPFWGHAFSSFFYSRYYFWLRRKKKSKTWRARKPFYQRFDFFVSKYINQGYDSSQRNEHYLPERIKRAYLYATQGKRLSEYASYDYEHQGMFVQRYLTLQMDSSEIRLYSRADNDAILQDPRLHSYLDNLSIFTNPFSSFSPVASFSFFFLFNKFYLFSFYFLVKKKDPFLPLSLNYFFKKSFLHNFLFLNYLFTQSALRFLFLSKIFFTSFSFSSPFLKESYDFKKILSCITYSFFHPRNFYFIEKTLLLPSTNTFNGQLKLASKKKFQVNYFLLEKNKVFRESLFSLVLFKDRTLFNYTSPITFSLYSFNAAYPLYFYKLFLQNLQSYKNFLFYFYLSLMKKKNFSLFFSLFLSLLKSEKKVKNTKQQKIKNK